MNSSSHLTLWQAPLAPLVLAMTAGIVLDRLGALPLPLTLFFLAVGMIGWLIVAAATQSSGSLLFLCLGAFALGAAYHHWHSQSRRFDDLGAIARRGPILVRLRGYVVDEIVKAPARGLPELRSGLPNQSANFLLCVHSYFTDSRPRTASGAIQVFLPDWHADFQYGDEIEVYGQLRSLNSPSNPGELDVANLQRDRGVRAVLTVSHSSGATKIVRHGWMWTVQGWLGAIRAWARSIITDRFPPVQQNLARALLLGEQSALEQAEWDRFQRTGVVHVLAISGQHLVILSWFLAVVLRVFYVPNRHAVIIVIIILLVYALLTGGRPPVFRAFIIVACCAGGLLLRRVTLPANSFALAWLLVCIWNPAMIFRAGCQLSFLASAVLFWGTTLWPRKEEDPLEKLSRESRPVWMNCLLNAMKWFGNLYAVTILVWLLLAPLVASRYHLVCPIGLLIGPPILLLTSAALIMGFLMFIAAAVFPPAAAPFAFVVKMSLGLCDFITQHAERLPLSWSYVADVPDWWLWGFYLLVFAGLALPILRRYWYWLGTTLLAWLCIGLAVGLTPADRKGLRCTFLDVGHGSCIVLETEDGRTIVYDAGALSGPEVSRRRIAPYLWSRGIRRIDELILSHADIDHFNGLPDLMQTFTIGRVNCTPTFAQRNSPGVQFTLEAIAKQRIPMRIVQAGDRLRAGGVQMHILHPPPTGPDGKENARSMVILLQHFDHRILLTGDLEDAGLRRVLSLPPTPVDVLMSPHHGSRFSNTDDLAKWSKPKLVVSCQGRPRGGSNRSEPYKRIGATYLTTWKQGAVTIHSTANDLIVETFRTKQRWRLQQ